MRATLSDTPNPVLWQECTHQSRTAPDWMRFGQTVGLTVAVLTVLAAWQQIVTTDGYPAMQTAIVVVWAFQSLAAVRAITAGANAISREHVGQTWDVLVLTGLSARQILLGKWGAALHSMRWWVLALGAVRLAMLPIFSVGIVKTFATVYQAQANNRAYYGIAQTPDFTWVPWAWFLAVAMSVLLTYLDILCCTALGLAASALTRRGVPAMILGIILRFLPVLVFSVFVRYQLGSTFFWRWWGRTEFSLSDAGTTAIMVLALPEMPWTRGNHADSLPGLFLAIAMLTAFLVLSLLIVWIVIRRTGGLPHPEAKSSPLARKS